MANLGNVGETCLRVACVDAISRYNDVVDRAGLGWSWSRWEEDRLAVTEIGLGCLSHVWHQPNHYRGETEVLDQRHLAFTCDGSYELSAIPADVHLSKLYSQTLQRTEIERPSQVTRTAHTPLLSSRSSRYLLHVSQLH